MQANAEDTVMIDREIERHARSLNLKYPDLVPRMMVDRNAIEYDEEDPSRAVNLRELVARFARDRPGLVDPNPPIGTPPRAREGVGASQVARQSIDDLKVQLMKRVHYPI